MLNVNNEVQFSYHGKDRNVKVVEATKEWFKGQSLDNDKEFKTFRFDAVDNDCALLITV
jgi:hypothetical protein